MFPLALEMIEIDTIAEIDWIIHGKICIFDKVFLAHYALETVYNW